MLLGDLYFAAWAAFLQATVYTNRSALQLTQLIELALCMHGIHLLQTEQVFLCNQALAKVRSSEGQPGCRKHPPSDLQSWLCSRFASPVDFGAYLCCTTLTCSRDAQGLPHSAHARPPIHGVQPSTSRSILLHETSCQYSGRVDVGICHTGHACILPDLQQRRKS